MITMCIRYTIDRHKLADFEQYARRWPGPIKRCGGELVGYFLPTKLAGPTNIALALINFRDLGAYEKYREELTKDDEAVANVAFADASRCLLIEDRSFLRCVRH
jgi:NIPSNAP